MAKRPKRAKLGFGSADQTRDHKKTAPDTDFGAREYLLLRNSGMQGSILFSSQEDYDRFEAYLYLLNAVENLRASNFFLDGREKNIFSAARGDTLIAIGAYSFTPKDFYLLVTPRAPNGVSKFMQKLQTAYTMYFNLKYQRSGRLFHSSYKSYRATDDAQLKYFLTRTHLAPAILFDQAWEEASDIDLRALAYKASKYRYSSLGEYSERKFVITAPEHFPPYFMKAKKPDELVRIWMRHENRNGDAK